MSLRSQWIRLGTLTLMLGCPALAAQARVLLMLPSGFDGQLARQSPWGSPNWQVSYPLLR